MTDQEKAGSERVPERQLGAFPLEEPLDPDTYICGAGDHFELHFWGQQSYVLRQSVGLTGRLFIPKVGYVETAGKSLANARTAIRKTLQRYYPGLNHDVALSLPRSFLVHLVGAVAKPGIYLANATERVSRVLDRAGGVREIERAAQARETADARVAVGTEVRGRGGSLRRIEVRRRDGKVVTADLARYYLTGDKGLNPYVLDGDVIRVPFEEVAVVVTGGVNRPGRYELVRGKDLAEAVELAGGLQSSVTSRLPIRVVRRNAQEQDEQLLVKFDRTRGSLPAVPLRDEDRVYVPAQEELQRSIYLFGAIAGGKSTDEATAAQRIPFEEGDTVRTVIERAGGVGPSADLKRAYIVRTTRGPNGSLAIKVIPVDLDALLVKRDFAADVHLEMGDQVSVPFKRHAVAVQGAVMKPGVFQFNPKLSIDEYVANAGGTTKMAQSRSNIRVVTTEGQLKTYKRRPALEPGDTIVVPERTFSPGEMVQIVISVASLAVAAAALAIAARR
ncbi:MAG: SLBB domain-containing protein [Deltaproteobacteria bacterium]|nr:SLBB domain-containing protein [Deltaproteobacteria bacterium]